MQYRIQNLLAISDSYVSLYLIVTADCPRNCIVVEVERVLVVLQYVLAPLPPAIGRIIVLAD